MMKKNEKLLLPKLKLEHDENNTLGTKYGVLNSKYCRSQFTAITHQGLTKKNFNQQNTVSVRAAARAQSIGKGQSFLNVHL